MFKPVDPKVNFPQLEDKINNFWKENKIFEKSISSRPEEKKWTFLDGPPFVTGVPHYGNLLSSLPKDLFGRYWTMKGYRVRRVWGWDGHGLPIENKVENKLNVKSKKEIEQKIGIDKFVVECKKYVENISGEWEWYVDKIGRWVDFRNAYKTWDIPYMESVMWVFKQMFDKGYIYKGLRVTLFCPHCSTPISNFEVAMDADNYKDVSDFGTVYKYKLEKDTYILAWSTTPWNKIVTPALAVNPMLEYVKVKQGNECYVLAKTTLKILKDEPYQVVEKFKGEKLIGIKFEPHYDYYQIKPEERAFEIIGGDFVTADEGTGVVTIAAYGEDDLKAMNEQNVHIETHLDEEGNVLPNVPKFGGMYYLKANKAVNEDLLSRNLIYKDEQFTHSVPLCWRCATRLYYAPIDAWYVNIQNLKPELKNNNEKVNWFPKHFKTGRFLKSLESAPDWNISRNRYWGSPVPVWECECGERFVPGSIKELEEASGREVKELHKPYIDEVEVKCKKCGKKAKRTPEVLDSWIEAGSASFAERHYPFAFAQGEPFEGEKLKDFFPPDFIAEYTGQIRAWFYVLHIIGTVIYDSHAFKNVVVEGVILGTDGRKMSKNFGNYPDPKELLQKYGGDALRLYLMGSPVMHGEDIIISEENYRQQVKGIMLILWNVYNFFVTNAIVDNWSPKSTSSKSENVLDEWILARLNETIRMTTNSLDSYDTVSAINSLSELVSDLSLWYIRRSRDRVGVAAENKIDKEYFYETTYLVLVSISKLIAPITPFLGEEMFKNLTGKESVHLEYWLKTSEDIDEKINLEMNVVRKIVEMGLSQRKERGIRVRQPLGKITYSSENKLSEGLERVMLAELNIKQAIYEKGQLSVEIDVDITDKLRAEGEARDIVRMIQEERKNLGTALDEKVDVTLPSWPEEFESEIKRKALINELSKGEFTVKRK